MHNLNACLSTPIALPHLELGDWLYILESKNLDFRAMKSSLKVCGQCFHEIIFSLPKRLNTLFSVVQRVSLHFFLVLAKIMRNAKYAHLCNINLYNLFQFLNLALGLL